MRKFVRIGIVLGCAAACLVAYSVGGYAQQEKRAEPRVFELRSYTPAPGKMAVLQSRFRDHTVKLFERHGMTSIGYWVTTDAKDGEPKFVYLLAHRSRDAAQASWRAFGADPGWQGARAESEKEGKLTAKVESVYLAPTDFSALK